MKQLDLEKIDITSKMYEQLSKFLNKNNHYMKEFTINNKDDLFDEKKLIFITYSLSLY